MWEQAVCTPDATLVSLVGGSGPPVTAQSLESQTRLLPYIISILDVLASAPSLCLGIPLPPTVATLSPTVPL